MNITADDYEIIRYPGGELQVRIKAERVLPLRVSKTVRLDFRVCSSDDLMALLLLSNAIRTVSPGCGIHLRIPYLPYARADRRFTPGDCFGLEVLGNLLRAGFFAEIHTLDVHNLDAACENVSSFLINHNVEGLISFSLRDFQIKQGLPREAVAILYPDEGAKRRYGSAFADSFYATKDRDPVTGEIRGFSVPELQNYGAVLVVDDICDGGGTFKGIASAIKAQQPGLRFALYITHGIFSKGLEPLDAYDAIYCTLSFKPLTENEGGKLVVYDAWEAMS